MTSETALPAAVRERRLERLRGALAASGHDCLVTTTNESFAYLTGVWIATLPWLPGRRVYGVLSAEHCFCVVSSMQSSELRTEGVDDLVEYIGDDHDPERFLRDELKRRGLGAASLIEREGLLADVAARLERAIGDRVADGTPLLHEARRIKDAFEIDELSRMAAIVNEATLAAVEETRIGDSEIDFARRLSDHALARSASDGFLVVGSGPRSQITHAAPTQRRLEDGDVLRVDAIRRAASGYLGDVARTILVGEPREEQVRCFEATAAGLEAAIAALQPHAPIARAYEGCAEAFAAHGFEMGISHVGHSIGIGLHESPMITAEAKEPLLPNTMLCIETIIAAPDAWYHLERLVQVTESHVVPLAGADGTLLTIRR